MFPPHLLREAVEHRLQSGVVLLQRDGEQLLSESENERLQLGNVSQKLPGSGALLLGMFDINQEVFLYSTQRWRNPLTSSSGYRYPSNGQSAVGFNIDFFKAKIHSSHTAVCLLLLLPVSLGLLSFRSRKREKMSEGRVAIDMGTNGASKHQPAGLGQQRRGATVSFHNIDYKVTVGGNCLCRKKGMIKEILIDLNGLMKPGLNAIMGATGSGNHRFWTCWRRGRTRPGSPEVLIDGAHQPPNFKCLSGYVVQDDVVMGTLTVRENFTFSAALRLPASVSQEEKEQKVEKLIQELGLGRVADSRRKRTNIGMELIIDPPVLFLDEPTTGLDASTANSVLLLLKRMANSGRTIILSIHQPRYSIYRLFDSLTLLVHGKQVYHGSAQTALDYFSDIGYTCEPHNNPADFFLDIINGDSSAAALALNSKEERITEGKKSSSSSSRSRTITYKTGFFTQFRWVLKRTFQNLLLNPQTSIAQIAVTLFLALIVGFIFFGVKNDPSGLQNSHEYISGYYRVSVYFLCKMLSDIIALRTIPAVVFSCVSYFMIGLKPTVAAFFTFMFSVTMVAYTATAMALAISADQTIFAGLLVNLPSIASWLAWLKYFSIPRYGLAVYREEFLDNQGVDWSTWGLWQNHVALGVMTFCFLTIAYLKLRFIRKFT
ncbi:hypothetical protein F7725_004990 [Dissostichus mawsoni]|uniref:ABC transporter domain-containing protein n=1 Tax=Dissostichus mawsoni TaxID=36200 RepID=A0A7J5XKB3_DISMA|nr:hypothetical protein F7725_004990 [Dissostichus mawsoni]